MRDKPLYEDKTFRIDYLPKSPEDHVVYFKEKSTGEELNYIIQRGVLRDLAQVPTTDLPDLVDRVSPMLLFVLDKEGVPVEDFQKAVSTAYNEEEKRFEEFKTKHSSI